MTSVGFGVADPLAGFRAFFDISFGCIRNRALMLGRSLLDHLVDRFADGAEQAVAPVFGERTFAVVGQLAVRFRAIAVACRERRALAAFDRQRRAHEIAPDFRRDGAAADLAQRLVVVAADPDADHQVAGEADEQRVAIVLGADYGDSRRKALISFRPPS